jgi:hypothetical protein
VIPLSSQFNTLVQGLSISSITPQQILAAGEPIFLDIKTSADIEAINTLIQSYARIHSPAYGTPIALSGGTASLVGDGDILTPGNQQVALISALQCENIAVGTMDIVIAIGGVAVSEQTLAASKVTAINLNSKYITKNTPLSVSVLSGDGADLTTSVSYTLTSQ